MVSPTGSQTPFTLGQWTIDPLARTFSDGLQSVRVDPKAIDLLVFLAQHQNTVVTREEIFAYLWPNSIVGEDTLAKIISRLRKALGDTAANPTFIETVPKRGYRLLIGMAPEPPAPAVSHRKTYLALACIFVTGVLLAGTSIFNLSDAGRSNGTDARLIRADNLYMQFTRADNEAAIGLYEQVLAEYPDNSWAESGLANALVQRVVRWSEASPKTDVSLRSALAIGATSTADAERLLDRAEIMAERAVLRAPDDPAALKAYGLVLTAQGRLDEARNTYAETIKADPQAWTALLNLGEIYLIEEDKDAALASFEQAYTAMAALYLTRPAHIGGWQAELAVTIGQLEAARGELDRAEEWFDRALAIAPFHEEATTGLAAIYDATRRPDALASLCQNYTSRIGPLTACNDDE